MSCRSIINFIRYILCCYVGEDEDYEPIIRFHYSYDRSYTSTPTVSTPLIRQSDSYPISYSSIQRPSNVQKFPEKSTVQTQVTSKISNPSTTNLPRKVYASTESSKEKVPQDASIFSSRPRIRLLDSDDETARYSPAQKLSDVRILSEKSTTSSVETQVTRVKTSIPPTVYQPQKANASYGSTVNIVSQDASIFSSKSQRRPLPKPTIKSIEPSASTNGQGKTNYVWVHKDKSSTYSTPEELKNLFERNIVPPVLKKDVTPSTYKEYFQTLLYAEDFYIEKWNGFEMKDLNLKLHEAAIHKKGGKGNVNEDDEQDEKTIC